MYSAQWSSPFSTMHVSRGLRVSGQAQQILSFGFSFSTGATFDGISEEGAISEARNVPHCSSREQTTTRKPG